MVIMRNTTERRKVEDPLRESEERFRRVVEHIGHALIVDDAHGHIVFANEQFLQLFGLKRSILQHVTFEGCVAPEYRNVMGDRQRRRIRAEEVTEDFEFEGIRADGTRLWLE